MLENIHMDHVSGRHGHHASDYGLQFFFSDSNRRSRETRKTLQDLMYLKRLSQTKAYNKGNAL